MDELGWSQTTPNEDGFFWLRRPGERDTIVKVWDTKSGLVECGAMIAWVGSDWDMDLCEALAKWHCFWAGPILPPNVEVS